MKKMLLEKKKKIRVAVKMGGGAKAEKKWLVLLETHLFYP